MTLRRSVCHVYVVKPHACVAQKREQKYVKKYYVGNQERRGILQWDKAKLLLCNSQLFALAGKVLSVKH